MTTTADAALVRLASIEGEVALLKRKLTARAGRRGRVTLQGIWKDIQVTEEDFRAVKDSWVKKLDDIV